MGPKEVLLDFYLHNEGVVRENVVMIMKMFALQSKPLQLLLRNRRNCYSRANVRKERTQTGWNIRLYSKGRKRSASYS